MKAKYRNQVEKLRGQIDYERMYEMKYLTQEVTRKNLQLKQGREKVKRLRRQFSKSALVKELGETKQKLKNSQRYRKRAKDTASNVKSCSCDEEITKLKDELSKFNAAIQDLETEKLCLEEKVEELKSEETESALQNQERLTH